MRPFNSANVVINLPSLLGNDHSNDLYVCLRLDKFVNWFSNLLLAQKWPIYPRIRPLWKLMQGIDSREDQSILNSPFSKTLIHFETYLFFLKSYRQRLFKLTPFNDIDDLSSWKYFANEFFSFITFWKNHPRFISRPNVSRWGLMYVSILNLYYSSSGILRR